MASIRHILLVEEVKRSIQLQCEEWTRRIPTTSSHTLRRMCHLGKCYLLQKVQVFAIKLYEYEYK